VTALALAPAPPSVVGFRLYPAFEPYLTLLGQQPALIYGVDGIFSRALFLLCLAPIGREWSLDALRARRRSGASERPTSRWGFACLRLLQIQVAIVMLHSALAKVSGQSWTRGYALWIVSLNPEYAYLPARFLADHFWIPTLAVYAVLLFELAYPFLIWGRATRPWMLSDALLLHLGIGAATGLYVFSLAMISVHLPSSGSSGSTPGGSGSRFAEPARGSCDAGCTCPRLATPVTEQRYSPPAQRGTRR